MQRTCWVCSDARICVTAVDMLVWDGFAGVSFRVCPCLRVVDALDVGSAKSVCCLDVRRTCFLQFPIATERSFHCCEAFNAAYVFSPQKKKKKNFTSFGQPTRLITCANHGNTVICS